MGDNMSSYNPDALLWLEGHIASWLASPTTIGLTSAQTTSLATDIINARTAFTSVQQARDNSKDKTAAFKAVADTMRTNASPLISQIKAYADNAPNPSQVYTEAGVLPKSAPSPVGPPAQPTGLKATLNGDGTITINFEGTGPVGTVWNISRKLATETSFNYIGFADQDTKSFIDTDVTPGTTNVSYIVRGVRAGNAGLNSQAMTVYLGSADGEVGQGSEAA